MASTLPHKTRKITKAALVTGFTLVLLLLFLSPFAFMVFTSLKTPEQISVVGAPIWPAAVATYEVQRQASRHVHGAHEYLHRQRERHRYQRSRPRQEGHQAEHLCGPEEPGARRVRVQGLLARAGSPVEVLADLQQLQGSVEHRSTSRGCWGTPFSIAIMSTIGVLISCTLVAYGFSRFDFPGRDFLFIV